MTVRALRVWLVVVMGVGLSLAGVPAAWAEDATPVPVETDAPSPPVDVPVATEAPTEAPVFTADAVAPALLLNGQPSSLTVSVGTRVTITTDPQTAMFSIWDGGACSGDPIVTFSGAGATLTRTEAVLYSVQAFDPANPATVSPCLTLSWVVPAPTLLMNGQAGSLTVPFGTRVTVTTDPQSASFNVWDSPDCSGDPIVTFGGAGASFTRTSPLTYSMQAFDPAHPGVVSACQTVTWMAAPPTLLLNGQAGSLSVSTGTDIIVTTDPTSASFNLWTNGDCSGDVSSTFGGAGTTFSSNDPLVNSVQAFDPANPAAVSACLTLTWTAPTPTPTPTTAPIPVGLFLDGQASSITIAVGVGITVTSDPQTSTIQYWENVDCSGTASGSIGSGFVIQGLAPQVLSFRASDPADATNTSACLAATWAEPTPTPVVTLTLTPTPVIVPGAPILYLNGWPNSIVVPLRTLVTVTSDPPLATLHYWANADCSGDPAGILGSGSAIEGDAPDVLSFQAEDQGMVGACLSATWGDVQITATPGATATSTPTEAVTTPTATEPTATPTVTGATVTPTATTTGNITATPTATTTGATVTPTSTATGDITATPTGTSTVTASPTATFVPTGAPTGTIAPSPSPSPVRTHPVISPTAPGTTITPTSATVRTLPNTGAGAPGASSSGNSGALVVLLLVGSALLASGTACVRRSPHRRR